MEGTRHEAAPDGGPGAARARATETVQTLLQGLRRGVPVAVMVGQLRDDAQDAALRAAVATGLRESLAAALTTAWRRGWQPAHVVHAAQRSLSEDEVDAVAAGIRQELGTYARSTVDAGWWDQVAGLGGRGSQGRRRSRRGRPAAGRCGVRGATWSQLCGDLAAATVFVERLPPLPVLGPLPGQVRHDDGAAPPDVDDKLLTRVRRLLAQAEGTPYEAEAETFTAAAQSLMARHRIDRAMLEADEHQARAARGPGAVRLPVDRPYEQPKMLLLSVIASANRCRALWNQSVGFATVVGHTADRRAVELLYTSLLVQATTAMRREGERRDGSARTRGFRSSFLSGFAARIGQRLEEASHTAETEARAGLEGHGHRSPVAGGPAGGAPTAADGGDRVGLVLRRRDEEVERLVRDLFPHTVRTRSRAISDHTGWWQGRAAADRATLGVGGRLAGGPS